MVTSKCRQNTYIFLRFTDHIDIFFLNENPEFAGFLISTVLTAFYKFPPTFSTFLLFLAYLKMSTAAQTPVRYSQTANPNNKENTDLHASRYRTYIDPEELKIRDDETPEQFLTRQQNYVDNRREEFKEFYKTFDWRANKHMHLSEDMKTTKLVMDPLFQRFMFSFQTTVVDDPYKKFGKVAESWEDYTLMFRNGFNAGRDERKPITEEFQVYLEKVYCPVLWTLCGAR